MTIGGSMTLSGRVASGIGLGIAQLFIKEDATDSSLVTSMNAVMPAGENALFIHSKRDWYFNQFQTPTAYN